MAEKVALDKAWAEAARRCRLSPADVRMAKELGFKPRSLLKNQPSPQQPWKAPVAEWVRDLYAKRQRRSEQRRQRRERAQEAMVDLTNADPSVATPTSRRPACALDLAHSSNDLREPPSDKLLHCYRNADYVLR